MLHFKWQDCINYYCTVWNAIYLSDLKCSMYWNTSMYNAVCLLGMLHHSFYDVAKMKTQHIEQRRQTGWYYAELGQADTWKSFEKQFNFLRQVWRVSSSVCEKKVITFTLTDKILYNFLRISSLKYVFIIKGFLFLTCCLIIQLPWFHNATDYHFEEHCCIAYNSKSTYTIWNTGKFFNL